MRIFRSFIVIVLLLAVYMPSFAYTKLERTIVFFERSPEILNTRSHTILIKNLKQDLEFHKRKIVSFMDAKSNPNDLWAASAIVLNLSQEQISKLKSIPGVDFVTSAKSDIKVPFIRKKIMKSPVLEIQWGIEKMRVPKVWEELDIDGSGIVIGHMDSGVASTHQALKGQVIRFKDFSMSIDGDISVDDQGHGTHTAGSIVGKTNGIGVAPGAKLVVAKIFDAGGGSTAEWILSAMQWMLDPDQDFSTNDAPKLVSNSWGSSNYFDKKYWGILETWNAAGIIPVFSAGNNGYSGSKTISIPAAYPHCFAVGATTISDTHARFSSCGPVTWTNGLDEKVYIKPDVSAPGDYIVSANYEGGYVSLSGTSMACPYVAGIIALILQANPGLGVEEIREICGKTSVDLGTSGKDNIFGDGRVDAYVAVKKALRISRIFDRIEATQQILNQEICLSNNSTRNLLSAPYVSKLIESSKDLDASEFRALKINIQRNGSKISKRILIKMKIARLCEQFIKH